jgi:hypothetical protein
MGRIKTLLCASATALAAVLAQSAFAADQALPPAFKAPPPHPPASIFDGLYVSLSAGGTLTHANSGDVENEKFLETEQDFCCGMSPTLSSVTQTSGPSVFSSNTSGHGAGAVFTFSGGYNAVLWNSWLFGVQPEASWNLSKTQLNGTADSTSQRIEI